MKMKKTYAAALAAALVLTAGFSAQAGDLQNNNGTFTVDENGNVTGANGEFNGTLTVQGETNINADANVTGQLTAAGLQNANGTFNADANGNLTGNSVTTNRNSLNQVGGVSMFDGSLDADSGIIDDLTADSIQVGDSSNGKETTRIDGGTLSTGMLIVHDKLDADAISGNTLEIGKNAVTGKPTFTVSEDGWVTAEYGADISGVRLNGGRVLASGGLSAAGGKFSVDGATGNMSTEGSLTVEDGATINGGTTMNGGATVNGGLTADTISAMNGNFNVNEEGIHFRTEDVKDLYPKDPYHYYFDMNNEKGISFGHSNGASMSLNENGVTFAYGDKRTYINGDEISTGTVHAGLVQASDMYIGDANDPDNQVVTQGDLDKTIEGVTNSSVQWDDPQTKDSINGVGLKDGKITAENGGNIGGVEFGGNGTINAADGNFTVDENGNTGIGGNLDVAGDLTIKDGQGGYINVGDSITSIKDSIADVNGDISKVEADVAQNKEDISGIKDQIGSETLKTTSQTLTGAINENHNAIQTNKEAIGDVSALKGQDANGNKYTNLTDAVNGNYDAIQQTQTQVQQNTNAISSLSSQVNDLGGEIDNVGAISAALAGLHPLDYDGTGSKFQLAAAMGSYDGSQAAAIGGFYHFNEDVMMSVGGATAFDGDNKSAFNVGVSFRIGQGSSGKKVNSDDVLAQLNAMNEKIAALEAENQQLSEKVAALEGGEGAEAAEAE